MSENSHIDKIFREGLGERNFSNADAMWQKMEGKLNEDDRKKRTPFFFLLMLAGVLSTGIFVAYQFNSRPTSIAANQIATVTTPPIAENSITKPQVSSIATADKTIVSVAHKQKLDESVSSI